MVRDKHWSAHSIFADAKGPQYHLSPGRWVTFYGPVLIRQQYVPEDCVGGNSEVSAYIREGNSDQLVISPTSSKKEKISDTYAMPQDFPGGSDSKVSVYNAGDPGLIPGSGRSPGEGNGTPLQYYCLENPVDREAWQATVHGVTKTWTQLNEFTFTFTFE